MAPTFRGPEGVSVIATAIDGRPIEFDFSAGSYTAASETEAEALRALTHSVQGLVEEPSAPRPPRPKKED